MNIYLVDRTDDTGYDETTGAVVVASNTAEARETAKNTGGDQSRDVWNSAEVTRVGTALKKFTSPQVLFSEYHSG